MRIANHLLQHRSKQFIPFNVVVVSCLLSACFKLKGKYGKSVDRYKLRFGRGAN